MEDGKKINSHESDSILRSIFETVIDGIITINERGIVESLNPAAARIFGYNEDEVIGHNINMLMPEPYHSAHDSYLHNYHNTGIKKIIGIGREVLGLRKNGTTFPFLLSISETQLSDRKIFTGIVHDISQIKEAESALVESEYKFNAILNNAVDGIITINTKGIIELFNPAASKLFGYTQEEMRGKSVNALMPEPFGSQHDTYMQNYYNTGKGKIIGIGREVTAMKKDGTLFPINLSVSEVKIGERIIFTGIIHDITERKLAEEKLRRSAAALQRSNSELQDFAYVSSHDLQEPLRKIQSFGDRLKVKEGSQLSEAGVDYLDRMLNAAARMQQLINDLLTFSRVTTIAQDFVNVDLNNTIREVLSDIEISIEKSGASIIVDKLPSIQAEPVQMRQLFQNMLSNAIKFRKDDVKPIIKVYAKDIQKDKLLVSTPGDEMIELYFEDNGIGFDEKYIDKIFNIFQRLESKKFEGSGVGLAICRKIAIYHGGKIEAKSTLGQGTTFIVTLAKKQIKNQA